MVQKWTLAQNLSAFWIKWRKRKRFKIKITQETTPDLSWLISGKVPWPIHTLTNVKVLVLGRADLVKPLPQTVGPNKSSKTVQCYRPANPLINAYCFFITLIWQLYNFKIYWHNSTNKRRQWKLLEKLKFSCSRIFITKIKVCLSPSLWHCNCTEPFIRALIFQKSHVSSNCC